MNIQVEIKERRLPTIVGRASLYGSALSARSVEVVDLLSFLCSDVFREQVEAIRSTSNPNHRRELKKQLPAITPAGVFTPRRGNKYLRSYSGMLCIDIDGKDNPEVEDWSTAAHRIGRHSPSVVYAGLSVGGCGCFVLYRIAEPWRYAEHYASIVAELSSLGLNVDTACKDIARLRFASYDPTPYLNPEAVPHTLPTSEAIVLRKGKKEADLTPQRPLPEQVDGESASVVHRAGLTPRPAMGATALLPRIERAVAELVDRGLNIAEAYNDWYRIGCSLASAFGEAGRWMYHAISAQSAKYERTECDAQYRRCMRSHGIGIGTLLGYFKAAGVRW